MPDTGPFHRTRLRLRAIASLVSETLRENPESRHRRHLIKKYKGTENGQVLILGNGPSVNNLTVGQILRFQAYGGKVVVMNDFLFSSLAIEFLPDYYFIFDPDYWKSTYQDNNRQLALNGYFEDINPNCTLVQGANYSLLSETHGKYLFVDHRSIQGLWRSANPNKPWGLPSSVAMGAIATMKYLGFSTIYFAGLDSDSYKSFFVDDLNEVMFSSANNYFYTQSDGLVDPFTNPASEARPMGDWPIRHMSDVLYAAAIFMRDFHWLVAENCVNVGNDRTNDSAPRACLLH